MVRNNIPGVCSNVCVVDFSGFYPNLIKTFNLSGDMIKESSLMLLDKKLEEIQDVKELLPDKMYEYDKKTNMITYKIKTNKFKADLKYDLSRKGVMAEAVEKLMELRTAAKQEMEQYKYGTKEYMQKDKIQFSYKFIINAAYGTSAYPGFRLYSNENANAITGFARMLSKWMSYRLAEKGWKTLGGDTDSLFLQLFKSEDLKENLIECKEIIKNINIAINEFVLKFLPPELASKHTLGMDVEKIYSKLLLLDVKKRYIGRLKYYNGKKTNKIHFMGVDLKKSNTIKISKDAQMDLALSILKNEKIEPVLKKYYEMVLNADDIDLFKSSSKLEKHQSEYKVNTPAVRSSLWSNKHLKTTFRGGTKFYTVYVEENKGVDIDVIAFDNVKQLKNISFQIDKKKYLKDVYNKFNNLIRGIPSLAKINDFIYNPYLTNNRSLGDWI